MNTSSEATAIQQDNSGERGDAPPPLAAPLHPFFLILYFIFILFVCRDVNDSEKVL